MAIAADYIGCRFGEFRILDIIARGAEAEVFLCINEATRKTFALALGVQDDELWEGNPLIPPRNMSEWNRVKNGFASEYLLAPEGPLRAPIVYGVVQDRYVEPVFPGRRVQMAWSAQEIIKEAKQTAWDDWLPWKLLVEKILDLLLIGEHMDYKLIQFCGIDLEFEKSLMGIMESNALLQRKKGDAMWCYAGAGAFRNSAYCGQYESVHRPVSSNLLFCVLFAGMNQKMSLSEISATIRCPFFRANLARQEQLQFHYLRDWMHSYLKDATTSKQGFFSNLKSSVSRWFDKSSPSVENFLDTIDKNLTCEPIDIWSDSQEIDRSIEMSDNTSFPLLLREYIHGTDLNKLNP